LTTKRAGKTGLTDSQTRTGRFSPSFSPVASLADWPSIRRDRPFKAGWKQLPNKAVGPLCRGMSNNFFRIDNPSHCLGLFMLCF
jgi:hypothetical protein